MKPFLLICLLIGFIIFLIGIFTIFTYMLNKSTNTANKNIDVQLLGKWKLEKYDTSFQRDSSVKNEYMEFKPNGELDYIIDLGDKQQIMKLTFYSIDGIIVSNQPSDPREEKTKYYFDKTGKLVLDYQDKKGWYIKVE